MKCPIDGTVLQMSDKQGVEIDYCPQCRGVWLDRGELDKILERSGESSHHEPARTQEHHREEHHSHDDEYKHKKHKKEGFLGDIFDF